MNVKSMFGLLKDAFNDWKEDKASRLAAALAYYTAFSIAPMLLIAIWVAGLIFGDEAARGQVSQQLSGLLGPDAASVLETAIQNSSQSAAGGLSAIVGVALLLWSASNVFAQLQDALNTVWEVQPKPGRGIMATLKKRFLSMSMVLGTGFLLLVSLVLSAGLAALGRFFSSLLPGADFVWQILNFALSFLVVTLLFAAIYKVLPDVQISWSDVWIGAGVTALLFTIGKLVIGLYLGNASVGSTYGAAGSLLILLVWVYYSAQILFFGAEFTQVYARRFGSRIVPDEDAVSLTPDDRARQGIPRQEHVERAARSEQPLVAARTYQMAADSANGHNGSAAATANGTLVKKLMWTGLASGSMALAGLAARRVSSAVWKVVLRQPPPTSKV